MKSLNMGQKRHIKSEGRRFRCSEVDGEWRRAWWEALGGFKHRASGLAQ